MAEPGFETARPDDYLERVAAEEVGRSYKAQTLELLGAAAGETVVDLGCGPGADLAALAGAVTPAGRVLGIDVDAAALARAQAGPSRGARRAAGAGRPPPVAAA